jgi:hypothetical protein
LGPRAKATAYFETLGYTCPAKINPADFVIDIIDQHRDRLVAAWRDHGLKGFEIDMASQSVLVARAKVVCPSPALSTRSLMGELSQPFLHPVLDLSSAEAGRASGDLASSIEGAESHLIPVLTDDFSPGDEVQIQSFRRSRLEGDEHYCVRSLKECATCGYFPCDQLQVEGQTSAQIASPALSQILTAVSQFPIFVSRSIAQLLANRQTYYTDAFMLVMLGTILGSLFQTSSQGGPDDIQASITDLCTAFLLSGLCSALIGIQAALRVFGPEKIVAYRESAWGVSFISYFLAKLGVYLIVVAVYPLIFLVSCRCSKWKRL